MDGDTVTGRRPAATGNLDMVKLTVRGSVVLLVGNIASTVILAISSITVARLLAPDGYGLYVLTLIPATFLSFFPTLGISQAATKYVAGLRIEGKLMEIRQLVRVAFIFTIAVGLVFTLLLAASSNFFASSLLDRPHAAELVAYSSMFIIGQALLQVAGGILVGLEKMRLYAALLVSQAICQFGLSVFLIIASFGVSGAVIGNVVSYAAAGILGLVSISKLGYLTGVHVPLPAFSKTVGMLLRFGTPVFLANLIIAGITQYQGFVLARFVSDTEIGNFAAAFNFITFMTILTLSISISLLPAFSKINPSYEAPRAFGLSVKYSTLLMVPLSLFIMASANILIDLTYGQAYAQAGSFLSLYVSVFLSTGLGYVVLNSFFMGLGASKQMLYISLVTLIIIGPAGWILTYLYGVYGLIGATIIANFAGTGYGLIIGRRRFGIRFPSENVPKIYIASLLSALPLFLLNLVNPIHNSVANLLLYGGTFLLAFLVILPLTGGLVVEDIEILAGALEGFQFVRSLIKALVAFESKLIELR